MSVNGCLVSIVLPTFNGEKFIAQSIDSCLSQTYKNIELIIVNDASTDNTLDVITPYLQDSRVKLINHEVNKKLPAALNSGFLNARGEYLTWTSDDNLYHEDAIEFLVTFLVNNPTYGLVYSNYVIINEQGKIVRTISHNCLASILFINPIGPSFLYKREVYLQIGDYSSGDFLAEDYEYWLRVYRAFKIAFLDRCLYKYRCHTLSLTSTNDSSIVQNKTNSLRLKFFEELLTHANSSERNAFIEVAGNHIFSTKELYDAASLFLKIFEKNKQLKYFEHSELRAICFLYFKEKIRQSSKLYGPVALKAYFRFKDVKNLKCDDIVFIILIICSWFKRLIKRSFDY